jgi:hypothetical protein
LTSVPKKLKPEKSKKIYIIIGLVGEVVACQGAAGRITGEWHQISGTQYPQNDRA